MRMWEDFDFAVHLALDAGEILKKHFGQTQSVAKGEKGIDILTAADMASAEFLRQEIAANSPHRILTEEDEGATASQNHDGLWWVCDPLDGTPPFSRKDKHFAVSVALVENGTPILGAIYAPLEGGGTLYSAGRGKGARKQTECFTGGQIQKLSVSSTDKLQAARLAGDWSHDLEAREKTVIVQALLFRQFRQWGMYGSAALDIPRVAVDIDAYIYPGFEGHPGLQPWDTAAAGLIVQEAGGTVTDLEGNPWNPWSPSILATNGILHQTLLEQLKEVNNPRAHVRVVVE